MPRSLRIPIGALSLAGLLVLALPGRAEAQPVIFRAQTSSGNDTIYVGSYSRIDFTLDPQGAAVVGAVCPFVFGFSNGIILGANPQFDLDLGPVFMPMEVLPPYDELQGTDPDTVLFGFIDFGGGPSINSPRVIAHLWLVPDDTGHIWVDTTTLPPANQLSALDATAGNLPVDWQPADIVVAPCPVVMGDLDGNGVIDARDIIWMIIAVFKCDFPPCWPASDSRAGDVNCSGDFTSADIIYLVNHVFKGGIEPCACFPTY